MHESSLLTAPTEIEQRPTHASSVQLEPEENVAPPDAITDANPLTVSPRSGPSTCSRCCCPGFSGWGSCCSRSGCCHHYDEHW